jgi:hypothetical protein
MKSYSLIGVLGAGLTAILFGACTVTTNNYGADGGDAGTSSGGGDDGSTTGDGGGSSSGSSSGSTSSSGSSSGSAEASTDAGTCTANVTVGSAACDNCIKASCCTELTACDTADDAGLDDAGNTACENLLGCALSYAAANDAAVGSGDLNTCAGATTDAAPSGATATATTLLNCAMAHCAAQCQ